jgi:hypothetical protein
MAKSILNAGRRKQPVNRPNEMLVPPHSIDGGGLVLGLSSARQLLLRSHQQSRRIIFSIGFDTHDCNLG